MDDSKIKNQNHFVVISSLSVLVFLSSIFTIMPLNQEAFADTFGYALGDRYEVQTTNQLGTACPIIGAGNITGPGTTPEIRVSPSNSVLWCERNGFVWDISSIPDDAIITNVTMRYDIDFAFVSTSPRGCDWKSLEHNPLGRSKQAFWDDIGNGTTFFSNNLNCNTVANDYIFSSPAMVTDLQDNLDEDFWGIGLKFTNEARSSSNVYRSEVTAPELQVTYTLPPSPPEPITDLEVNIKNTTKFFDGGASSTVEDIDLFPGFHLQTIPTQSNPILIDSFRIRIQDDSVVAGGSIGKIHGVIIGDRTGDLDFDSKLEDIYFIENSTQIISSSQTYPFTTIFNFSGNTILDSNDNKVGVGIYITNHTKQIRMAIDSNDGTGETSGTGLFLGNICGSLSVFERDGCNDAVEFDDLAEMTIYGGNARAILNWNAPADNGNPITGYEVLRANATQQILYDEEVELPSSCNPVVEPSDGRCENIGTTADPLGFAGQRITFPTDVQLTDIMLNLGFIDSFPFATSMDIQGVILKDAPVGTGSYTRVANSTSIKVGNVLSGDVRGGNAHTFNTFNNCCPEAFTFNNTILTAGVEYIIGVEVLTSSGSDVFQISHNATATGTEDAPNNGLGVFTKLHVGTSDLWVNNSTENLNAMFMGLNYITEIANTGNTNTEYTSIADFPSSDEKINAYRYLAKAINSGGTASASNTAEISPDRTGFDLWDYREHDTRTFFTPTCAFGNNDQGVFTMNYSGTPVGFCDLFKSFDKTEITGSDIRFTLNFTDFGRIIFQVIDGSYDKDDFADFPLNDGHPVPVFGQPIKGIGLLNSTDSFFVGTDQCDLTHGGAGPGLRQCEIIIPASDINYAGSTEDEISVFLKLFSGKSAIGSVEISNVGSWEFTNNPRKVVGINNGAPVTYSLGASENQDDRGNLYSNGIFIGNVSVTNSQPDQVTGLNAISTSTSTIVLEWNEPGDGGSPITGYKIERESPIGGGFTTIVSDTGSTATSFHDTSLLAATEYNYRVSAINSIGTGTASTQASAITDAEIIETLNPLFEFGSFGTGDGQFDNPQGVVVDSQGRIIIIDQDNGRCLVFDSDGKFLFKFAIIGTGDGQLNSPTGVAVDSQDRIIIVDSGNNRIQVFDSSGNFLFKFGANGGDGSSGSGNGEFSSPKGVAVDSQDRIIIVDSGNNRIQVFDSSGVFIFKFGTFGTGNGEFDNPIDVTVDSQDRIIVVDSGNACVHVFDSNGIFLFSFGGSGTGSGSSNGPFSNPTGVYSVPNFFGGSVSTPDVIIVIDSGNKCIHVYDANGVFIFTIFIEGVNPTNITVDNTGRIIVVDSGGNTILVFGSVADFAFRFGSFGFGGGLFNGPGGVAIGSDGRIYVVDIGNNLIQVFNSSLTFLFEFGSGTLDNPTGVAIDSTGRIIVIDQNNHRCLVFDSNGNLLFSFGLFGTGNGQFDSPTGIAVDSQDRIIISDTLNNRIQVFDSSGTFLFAFGSFGTGNGQFDSPTGIAVNSFDNIIVADSGNNRIQVFDSSGNFLSEFGSFGTGNGQFDSPTGVAVDSFGRISIADQGNNRIQTFEPNGDFIFKFGVQGTGIGQFDLPTGIAIDNSGQLIVADTNNHRIQGFELASPPAQVTGLIATVSGGTNIDLVWNEPAGNVTGYKIERESPIGGGFSIIIPNTGTTSTTFQDTGLSPTVQYNYRVTGINVGGSGPTSNEADITIPFVNTPPVADDQQVNTAEDIAVSINLTASDVDLDPLTYAIVNTTSFGTLTGTAPNMTYTPNQDFNGADSFTFKANDGIDNSNNATVSITITPVNDPPVVGIITSEIDPIEVNSTINASANFTDVDLTDTHTAEWDWGDNTTSVGIVTENGLSGNVTGSHTYSTPGVFSVTLTVTDDTGDSGSSVFNFVVIYDPEGGFVTGGGWIDSPTGAYVPDSTLVGKATFGFVSKYQNGANTPTGNTQFSFKVADLKFKSTEYDWLVVAGSNANFKGTGTINGDGNYGFLLFGFDADLNTNDNKFDDKFRIKIWDKDNGDVVVYDNNLGESENAEPSTILGGGSIVIHQP